MSEGQAGQRAFYFGADKKFELIAKTTCKSSGSESGTPARGTRTRVTVLNTVARRVIIALK